jgi:hypothetical protein
MFNKKKISQFDVIYNYLKDGYLRAKKSGNQRIAIKDADFSGDNFKATSWQYFDFVDCDFSGSYSIMLDWLTDSTFTNCHFHGVFGMGDARKVRFLRCKIDGRMSVLGFESQTESLVFEDCEFDGGTSDPNHQGGILCHGEVEFVNCKTRWFGLGGFKKLVLRRCVASDASLDTAVSGLYSDETQMPYSDFLIEDCDLSGGVDTMNANVNNLTMRRCKVHEFGIGMGVRGNALVEDVKGGLMWLAAQGKLTVRNCEFMGINSQPNSLEISGCVPTHTLIENVTCGRKPVDFVGRSEPRTEWDNPPRNKSFVIRNCKIPHLKVDWAQTEHLRIESCEFDTLSIRDGRIGKLEIIGGSLTKLDVSRTQVKTQDVRIREGGKISGHVTVTEGSNIKLLPRN